MLKNKGIYLIVKIIMIIILTITILGIAIHLVVVAKVLISPDKIPDVFGYKAFLIKDEENTIVIFTKNTQAEDIQVDNPVVIKVDNVVVLQRISQKLQNNKFITTGDSNILENKEIDAQQIEGVYIGKSEFLGGFITFIQSPYGLISLITFLLIIILLTQIRQEKLYERISQKNGKLQELEVELQKVQKEKQNKNNVSSK